jgi:predicted TIM-barrel fold metal-dependent hydrolase
MHAHWRPAVLIDAMRKRTREPFITRNSEGVEVIKARGGDEPLSEAFDEAAPYLEKMDRQGVRASVLSVLGQYCWIEAQPVDVSVPLCRLVNGALSRICQAHEGRFAAYAAVPLVDIAAAAAELDHAMDLPGMVGAQLPANAFVTLKDADKMRPIFEVANRRRASIFIHWGPMPGDVFPRVPASVDNARRRNGTLEMQTTLSAVMVTLCLNDYLSAYPNAMVHVHNLGGNIPYEVERMDHRCLLDTPKEELPSLRFRCSRVYVDCNSFGPCAIEAAVRLYGAERVVCGTDGTEFGCKWTRNALAEADIGAETREKILHANAAAMLAHLAPLGQRQKAAA